jgi:S-adenosylmethionine-diacylgycerolhomoserine-N-methlytransferase
VLTDIRTLWHLARPRARRATHAGRLEAFYRGQARDYDAFRERLLPGRRDLISSLPLRSGATWVDLGGGTAYNLLHAGPALARLARVTVIDLTPSLLGVARRRCVEEGWTNVDLIEGDATAVALPDASADIVTCSYTLTMIPDWRAAVDEAERLLMPGGTFGVVDFHVSELHPPLTRLVWPWWFRQSGVQLSPEHLPWLERRFTTVSLDRGRTRLPYVPFGRVPFYRWTGIRPALSRPG